MSAISKVLALWTTVALVGCSAPPEIEETTEALGTPYANDKPAFDFFVGKGLTNFQAAGIVGNLDQESGVNPNSVQYGGGPGRGIAQWSVGGRWDTSSPDVVAYANSKGVSPWTLNVQLDFIWLELTTVGYGFSQLKATTNVTDATLVFMSKYEICGTCASATRISDAQAVLAAYGAEPSYKASYVSQSWPLASSPPLQIKCGGTVAANIVLKNGGTKAWDGNTRLGTTMQRDRASVFAGSDWLAPNRAAAIKGTVAPGANGTFSFSFHGPTGAACVPGVHTEYFGVVQEGVHWFSDNGEGGPPDNQLEAAIEVIPGDPAQGGSGGGSGGVAGGGGGGITGGTGGGGSGGGDAGGMPQQNGCTVGGGGSASGATLLLLCATLLLVRAPRRRRTPR